MEIIDKKKFAVVVLNKEDEIFVMHIATLSMSSNIYLFWEIQIILLDIKKVTIFSKYADYINVFLLDFVLELLKHTSINNHLINLINDKQLSYSLFHSLKLVEFEILKTYIETNLANGFIRPFKLPVSILILFICKKDGSFWLCINYHSLNKLTIKS